MLVTKIRVFQVDGVYRQARTKIDDNDRAHGDAVVAVLAMGKIVLMMAVMIRW